MDEPEHLRATYNDIHNIIKASAEKIAVFKPNLIIAIGDLIPARSCWAEELSSFSKSQDEVDDSRKTLQYALSELRKDVEKELQALPEPEREANRTEFAVFVVHNKLKPKLGKLPPDVPYFVGAEMGDVWLDYPWEATDIEEHDRLAAEDKTKLIGAS
ncbi:hypothetical protein J3R83DRAFT_8364 [Lanmaoa asiatica]|nr:hypothetical protein J3R83DRAFT_8364 [Lanmaoa asiatica]